MINFNVPPFTGKEMDYIKECVENQKICGDGAYTKKCNEWLEKKRLPFYELGDLKETTKE